MSDFAINYEKDTWVHRLDPRVKLLYILVFCTIPLFFTDAKYVLACGLLVVPVWLSAKIDPRPIRALLWAAVVFGLVTVLFSTFYNYDYPDNKVLLDLGFMRATKIGLTSGITLGIRAVIPYVVALLLICTTDPAQLAKAMMKMHMPMSVSFMMMGALRMFPLVSSEMSNVSTAQTIRGVEKGGFKKTFNAFKLAVTPLMINSLRKSRTTGLAVESKGFGMRAWKDYYQEFKFKAPDYIMLVFCIAVFVAAFVMRYVFHMGINPLVKGQ